MLINQTLDKLDAVGLFGMALGLREQLEQSQYLSLSFEERFGLLVDREPEARDSRRLALRLKAAKLRQEASVEDLDFRSPRAALLFVECVARLLPGRTRSATAAGRLVEARKWYLEQWLVGAQNLDMVGVAARAHGVSKDCLPEVSQRLFGLFRIVAFQCEALP